MLTGVPLEDFGEICGGVWNKSFTPLRLTLPADVLAFFTVLFLPFLGRGLGVFASFFFLPITIVTGDSACPVLGAM